MPILDNELELTRIAARISQSEMANHLRVSQSQVSRYEKDSGGVPKRTYDAWVSYCGDVQSKRPLLVGTPMAPISQRLQLIESYIEAQPSEVEHTSFDELEKTADVIRPNKLLKRIQLAGRKLKVLVIGQFDMGKSRFINCLMGQDSLPTSYQPATSIPVLIKHIDDKPEWQAEKVWIFKSGFDMDRADDQEHCQDHRLISGGYEALEEHGTHSNDGSAKGIDGAAVGVAYVDSDFLKGCDVIDSPGFGHQETDDKRAEMTRAIADIIVFVSNMQGFMGDADRQYLSQAIEFLPAFEGYYNDIAPLRNLYVLGTRADQVGDEQLSILDRAARECFDSIGEKLASRFSKTGVRLKEEHLRDRFFTYSAESDELRRNFEEDLTVLLGKIAPERILDQMSEIITEAKKETTSGFDRQIEGIEKVLKNQKSAQRDLEEVEALEPERLAKRATDMDNLRRTVDQLAASSIAECKRITQKATNISHVESIIADRYSDKKTAKKLAPSYIIEKLKQDINDDLSTKSSRLAKEVDAFLESYDVNISSSPSISGQWTFNAKGAFIGALAGFGTFGALAGWASIVAAGSNLGAYILIGKVVSTLAAIGINLGGTGTVFAFVAALGGPITLGAGIALLIGTMAFTLAGASWQKRLAKNITGHFVSEGVEKDVVSGVMKFWSDTRLALNHALAETEKDYQNKLQGLRKIAFETDAPTLNAKLEYLRELRAFFGGIPWKPVAKKTDEAS